MAKRMNGHSAFIASDVESWLIGALDHYNTVGILPLYESGPERQALINLGVLEFKGAPMTEETNVALGNWLQSHLIAAFNSIMREMEYMV